MMTSIGGGTVGDKGDIVPRNRRRYTKQMHRAWPSNQNLWVFPRMKTSSGFLILVDAEFRKFGDSLKEEESYLRNGVRKCEHVRHFLDQHLKSVDASIAEFVYGGSVAKKVYVDKPDFDITLKLNNIKPPFTKVLVFMENIFKEHHQTLDIEPKSVGRSEIAVWFNFTNGIHVDMLPAFGGMNHAQILKKVSTCPKRQRRFWSSGLVEGQVNFLKEQSAFVHSLVRFTKHWFKSIDLNGAAIHGGSCIFELLAVGVAHQDKLLYQRESMTQAFIQILEHVENVNNSREIMCHDFPVKWLIGKPPHLVDPGNLTKGLLTRLNSRVRQMLSYNASVMRQRMEAMVDQGKYIAWVDNTVSVDFNKLLQPV